MSEIKWEPTSELRWAAGEATPSGNPSLQQKWVEVGTGKEEWRSVPLVVVAPPPKGDTDNG